MRLKSATLCWPKQHHDESSMSLELITPHTVLAMYLLFKGGHKPGISMYLWYHIDCNLLVPWTELSQTDICCFFRSIYMIGWAFGLNTRSPQTITNLGWGSIRLIISTAFSTSSTSLSHDWQQNIDNGQMKSLSHKDRFIGGGGYLTLFSSKKPSCVSASCKK